MEVLMVCMDFWILLNLLNYLKVFELGRGKCKFWVRELEVKKIFKIVIDG